MIRKWHSVVGMVIGTEHISGDRISATEPNEPVNVFLIMSCSNQ